ncbi:MAG TPA: hypothetical protein VFS39_05170 [Nitrospira sp.]|nr:hypothetical protein [Nitrospira sp.]
MLGFGDSRPRYCVKFGSHALAWGERCLNWRGRRRYRCVVSPLPAGAAKLSPIEPNVVDPVVLEERLRTLAGPGPALRVGSHVLLPELPRSVTVLIPDLSARMTVLALDHVPSQRQELEALIRWKLGQEQQLPLAGMKLAWQVFPPAHGEPGTSVIFVAAVQQGIVAQYESLCESVGLSPRAVTVTTAELFNLWLRAAGGRRRLARDLACLTVLDDALTCVIFHHGRPVFVRTKFLSADGQDTIGERANEEKILREIAASFLACQERHPDVAVKEIVLMTEEGSRRLEDRLAHEWSATVDRLAWEHVRALGWTPSGGNTSSAVLPVVAAMV